MEKGWKDDGRPEIKMISYITMDQQMVMQGRKQGRNKSPRWMNDKPCTAFLDAEMNSRDLAQAQFALMKLGLYTYQTKHLSPLEVATDGVMRPFWSVQKLWFP